MWPWVMVGILILGGASAAQDTTGESGGETPELEPDDREDMEEVLRVLDEAGVPPTQEDMNRMISSSPGPGMPPGGPKLTTNVPVRGQLLVRVGRLPGQDWDRYARLKLVSTWVRLRARFRHYASGNREAVGTLELGSGPVEMRLGMVGLTHGYGLLAGAPGRGASLTADSGLGPPRARLVTWAGSADPRALAGVGVGIHQGPWSLDGIFGRTGPWPGDGGPGRGVIRIACARRDWRLAVALTAGEMANGFSLAGGLQRGPFFGNFESLIWQPEPGLRRAGAGLALIGWKLASGTGVEILLGMADLPRGPALANRPPVLPGWSGRGCSIRGTGVVSGGLRLRVLGYLGQEPDRVGLRGTENENLLDIQALSRIAPQVNFLIRFRRRARIRREWSERYPWQPAAVVADESREVGTLQLNRDGSRLSLRALVRTYGLQKAADGGRRGLMSLSARYRPENSWIFRGSWGTAWGDPVDLVSAVSPMTGMVLPRHWGHWRSETVVGVERVWGPGRFQAAVSWRNPAVESDPAADPLPALTLWFEAGFRW